MRYIKGVYIFLFLIFVTLNGYTYKITNVDRSVKLNALHLYLTPVSQDSISITYRFIVNYYGDKSETKEIVVSIPENSGHFEFLEGVNKQDVKITDSEMVIKTTLKSGENNIVIRMLKLLDLPHFNYKLRLNYYSENIYIVTPPEGISVKGENLYEGKVIKVQNSKIKYYYYPKLYPNMEVSFFVSLQKEASTSKIANSYHPKFHSAAHIRFWRQSPFRGINPHLFLMIIVTLPIFLIVYVTYTKRKRASMEDEDFKELLMKLNMRKQSLLEEIVKLDREFENGQLDEKTYRNMRNKAKERLAQIKMKMEKLKI
ncbi:hypothetical protein [Deferribacter abyssi]|uniref:hypothetical protein n=1 Tax=Deferribacter abyssi TaxID=213806 RepID=UPI003C1DD909